MSRTLVLRKLQEHDLPLRVSWFNNPELREGLHLGSAITEESTLGWFRRIAGEPERMDFVVEDNTTGEPLCMVGYRPVARADAPDFYIAVAPGRHGEGLGTAALILLFKHMRDAANLIGAGTEMYRWNVAVIRMCSKLGMYEVEAGLGPERMRMEIFW